MTLLSIRFIFGNKSGKPELYPPFQAFSFYSHCEYFIKYKDFLEQKFTISRVFGTILED